MTNLIKEKFHSKKAKKQKLSRKKKITNADYTDGTGLNVNSGETESMCFNQDGALSSLDDKPLKLVEQFIYLSSNISSTEKQCQCMHRLGMGYY